MLERRDRTDSEPSPKQGHILQSLLTLCSYLGLWLPVWRVELMTLTSSKMSRCTRAEQGFTRDQRSEQPPNKGIIVEITGVGGLRRRYERRAARSHLFLPVKRLRTRKWYADVSLNPQSRFPT